MFSIKAGEPDASVVMRSDDHKLTGMTMSQFSNCSDSAMMRQKKAKIRKRRNQKKVPTPKTEVGKKLN